MLNMVSKRLPAFVLTGLVSIVLLAGLLVNPLAAQAVSLPILPVSLGTAVNYGVLGGAGVTSTGDTVINGDLGAGPSSVIAGLPPGIDHGSIHAGDSQAVQAQADLAQAYSVAAGRNPTASFGGDQIGVTFDAGVYDSAAAVSLTGTMTLDGQNDPNAVFIFQIDAAAQYGRVHDGPPDQRGPSVQCLLAGQRGREYRCIVLVFGDHHGEWSNHAGCGRIP